MTRFIEVVESRYNDTILLNIDNIVGISEASGTVYTNAVHGEQNGLFVFNKENMQKIIAAAKKATTDI